MCLKHGAINTVSAVDLDSLERAIQGLLHGSVFSRSEPSQDIGDDIMTDVRPIDAHAQTVEISGAQGVGYGAQSVVTCQPSPFFEPNPPQGQVKLVMDNQDMRRVDFPIPEYLMHSPAASVHKRQRLEKKPGIALTRSPLPENKILFRFRRQLSTSGFTFNKTIHDHEPEIVTGPVVLTTGITETYDETGVSHGFLMC
jgi:hypothetical protein